MSGTTRKRPDRMHLLRDRGGAGLERLETRALMASGLRIYNPTYLQPRWFEPGTATSRITRPIGSSPRVLSQLDNEGRILTGKDRQGDEWQLTVHGPGSLVVTDVTPNDGSLDDDLNTIQIIGADPNKTYVTGSVAASARVRTDGTVRFNRLISLNGVKSIILNGFTLARTSQTPSVDPTNPTPQNLGPEIFLPGGARFLQFHNIEAPIDVAANDQPIEIVEGQVNTPLPFAPMIRLDSIFNTVFDSSTPTNPNGVPVTTPSVQIIVNGELRGLDMVSATNFPVPAGFEYNFPTVGTTGRTSVRAVGIGDVKVVGSAKNTTFSRGAVPFSGNTSGLTRLRSAKFGGNADAVGIDVNGDIGHLQFNKGLGNPTGSLTGYVNFGRPQPQYGYPAFGLLGGAVKAKRIRSLTAAPANLVLQTAQDPDFVQSQRTNSTTYYARPGNALTSAAITSDLGIHRVNIVGNSTNTEIKTGFNYPSYTAGLDGVRAPSKIRNLRQRGDLVDAVVSATYRTGASNHYGKNYADPTAPNTNVAGPGLIQGRFIGRRYINNGTTALGNTGAGFFAKNKIGYLPPKDRPTRIRSRQTPF